MTWHKEIMCLVRQQEPRHSGLSINALEPNPISCILIRNHSIASNTTGIYRCKQQQLFFWYSVVSRILDCTPYSSLSSNPVLKYESRNLNCKFHGQRQCFKHRQYSIFGSFCYMIKEQLVSHITADLQT